MPGDSRRGRTGEDRRVLLVGDLLRAVEDQFRIAFPRRLWVLGVVRGLQNEDPLEFLLTEIDETGRRLTVPAELGVSAAEGIDTTLRRLHDVAVDDLLVDGHLVRAGGLLSYDTDRHIMIFSVTALDPEPTRAWLADRRDGLRDAAHAARMGDRQRDVRVPLAPTSVGLVGSTADSGLAQARHRLTAEDFALDLVEYPVTTVGSDASDALATAVRQASAAQHDVVLLVREGGRPLALAAFDAEQVVRAVAEAGVPVISGLGSGEEPTAVDEVAHETVNSPDEAADAVLRRLHRASELVEQAADTLQRTGDEALRRAARRLEQKRAEVAETARRARARAQRAKSRRTRAIRLVAAVLAVLVVVLAVLVTPWLAVLLVIPLAVALFAERLRPRRRSSPMAIETLSFSAALQRLGDVQRELDEAADPDEVERLETRAAELADHCRSLLRRPRPLRDGRPAAVGTAGGDAPQPRDRSALEDRRGEPRRDNDEAVYDQRGQDGQHGQQEDTSDHRTDQSTQRPDADAPRWSSTDDQPTERHPLPPTSDATDGAGVTEALPRPAGRPSQSATEEPDDNDRTQAIRLPDTAPPGPQAPRAMHDQPTERPSEIDLRDRRDERTQVEQPAPVAPAPAAGPAAAAADSADEDTVSVPSDPERTEQIPRPQDSESRPVVEPPTVEPSLEPTGESPASDDEATVQTPTSSQRPGARKRTRARRPTGAAPAPGTTADDQAAPRD